MMFEVGHQVAQAGDDDDRNPVVALHFLHGRELTLAAFLAVEGDQHAGRRGAGGADQFDRLAYRGAGRNDVVDNQHPTGERRAECTH